MNYTSVPVYTFNEDTTYFIDIFEFGDTYFQYSSVGDTRLLPVTFLKMVSFQIPLNTWFE